MLEYVIAHRRRDHRPDYDLPRLGGEDGPAAGRLPDGPRLLRIPLLYVHLLHSRSGESEIKGENVNIYKSNHRALVVDFNSLVESLDFLNHR